MERIKDLEKLAKRGVAFLLERAPGKSLGGRLESLGRVSGVETCSIGGGRGRKKNDAENAEVTFCERKKGKKGGGG